MSIGRTVTGIFVLATSISVLAQTIETKRPDVGSSGATNSQSSAIPAPNPCGSGAKALDQAEILTDTMGVDFGPYLTRVVQIVKQNWYNAMPPSVYPPIFKQGKVSIEFVILKDGKVTGMAIRTSSGDIALDRAAWASITASDPSPPLLNMTASTPFPPLPKEFPGKLLGLRVYYYYNLGPTESGISISPCGDVQVPAGSTLQFSASVKGLTDTSVTWSVSGPGCSKSACGTISDSGLYTAPVDMPSPPKVFVKATSGTNSSVTTKVVTVVQANPSH
jgi:TonB family protein